MGLLPPGLELSDGRRCEPSSVQCWLWRCWLQFERDAVAACKRKPFVLIVNGDAIEGVHHGTTEIVSPDPGDHSLIAQHVLARLADKAAKVVMIRGTECHTRNSEAGLGWSLGAERDQLTGQYAHDEWTWQAGTHLIHVAHHIGASKRLGLYATQLSAELAEAQVQAARKGQPVPTGIIRSHRHTFGHYHDSRAFAVTLPAWQLRTRFGMKVVPGSVAEVGGVVLDLDDAPDGLPRVRPMVYTPAELRETRIQSWD